MNVCMCVGIYVCMYVCMYVRTLMRTTEPLVLPNQQIFTMRSLHYQLRAVIIDLSCLKVKSDL